MGHYFGNPALMPSKVESPRFLDGIVPSVSESLVFEERATDRD